MSQVDRNLAFSIEIAIFISVDVVEAVVLGEGRIWDNRRSVAFPVSELFDGAVRGQVPSLFNSTVSLVYLDCLFILYTVHLYCSLFPTHTCCSRTLPSSLLRTCSVKAITTSLHSRSVLGRVIVESLTKSFN